jgi:integrase
LHLETYWRDVAVGDVTPALVRSWHSTTLKRTGPTAAAQAYRLLRANLNVAVADEVLAANPCRLRSAGTPRPARPPRALTAEEVHALAEQVPDRYRALVLVLAFGGPRFGEATALQRTDVSPDGAEVRIERSVRSGLVGPPKTDAGRRTVALPAFVARTLTMHINQFVPADPPRWCSAPSRAGFSHARTSPRRSVGRPSAATSPQSASTSCATREPPWPHTLGRPRKSLWHDSGTQARLPRSGTSTPAKTETATSPVRSTPSPGQPERLPRAQTELFGARARRHDRETVEVPTTRQPNRAPDSLDQDVTRG